MKKLSNRNQMKFGAIFSYLSIGFNIVAGLLYTPWMIKSIGEDQYALYTLAMSVINIFLLDFGMGSAVNKFLSGFYAQNDQEAANKFMGIVYKVFFIISAAIALCLTVFYFLIDSIYLKLTPSELSVFKNLFIIVAVYSVFSFPCTTFNGILMSNERFTELKACNFLKTFLNVALIILFLILKGGVYALVLVHAFTQVLFSLIKYFLIRKNTKQKSDLSAWDKAQAKKLLNFSIWTTILTLSQRCIFNIMPTVIAALIGSTEVTLFSLAATIEGYIYSFADAINGMFLPKVSRILVSNNKEEKLNSLMIKVGKFHTYTMGLIIIGFFGVGRQFVELWMGKGFETIYYCAMLIIFPSLIDIPQQVARTSLLASDIIKQQALTYLAMGIINVALAFVLVPVFGALGAGISVLVAYLFRTFIFNLLYKKHLPVNLKKYFISTYKGWLIPAIISLFVGLAIPRLISMPNIVSLFVSGALLVLVYVVLLYIFAFDKKTKQQLISKLKNKR